MQTINKSSGTIALALLAAALSGPATAEQSTYTLESRRARDVVDRVEASLEVGGDLNIVVDGKLEKMKMSVLANLTYHERSLEVPTSSDGPLRSVRYYENALAVLQVDKSRLNPSLRDRRRLIGVEIDGPTVTLFSPQGTLTRDELDLVDVLGSSLLLDRLLPEKPLAVGGAWKHSETLLSVLLGLDAVGEAEVKSTLVAVTDGTARIEMSGRVAGTVSGAATKIELKGKYHFNLNTGRITWFGLLVQENRSVGHVETGFDVVARLQMKISPLEQSPQLADAALKGLSLKPTPELTALSYQSPGGGWEFTHDRRWFIHSDQGELAVLRLIDRGDFVAQCKVSALPKKSPTDPTTLAEFQNDVRHALGNSFEQFLEASQRANEADYRVYRVVLQGKASELAVRWLYYLVTDQEGRQVVLAFVFEEDLAARFEEADRSLVATLRLGDGTAESDSQGDPR